MMVSCWTMAWPLTGGALSIFDGRYCQLICKYVWKVEWTYWCWRNDGLDMLMRVSSKLHNDICTALEIRKIPKKMPKKYKKNVYIIVLCLSLSTVMDNLQVPAGTRKILKSWSRAGWICGKQVIWIRGCMTCGYFWRIIPVVPADDPDSWCSLDHS